VRPRCLILGGLGFLGAALGRELIARGHPLRIFDHGEPQPRRHAGLESAERIQGDFLDRAVLDPALEGCDYVFHLIGTTLPSSAADNPTYDLETNVLGTLRLLELLRRRSPRRLVFSSSGGTVYGSAQQLPIAEHHPTEPRTPYGVSKLMIEKYLKVYRHLHGLRFRVYRFSNPYGPWQRQKEQGVVSTFLRRVRDREPIAVWGDGSVVRDFLYIEDLARAVTDSFGLEAEQDTFNCGSGQGTSVRELIDLIRHVTGRAVAVEHSGGRPIDVPANVLDSSALTRLSGWRPKVSLREGVERTWQAVLAE